MNWIVSDYSQKKAIEEIIGSGSDRASAIVAAAFVERDLRNAIEARLLKNKDLTNKMFKPAGPMGPFEVKADFGLLLGVYGHDVHGDLLRLVKIRNTFAHSREPIQFGSRDIKRELDALVLVDKEEYPKIEDAGLPEEFRSPARLPKGAPYKDRLITTVQIITLILWLNSRPHIYYNFKEGGGAWSEGQPASWQ